MKIEFDEKSDKCLFPYCVCQDDGHCNGSKERQECLQFAFAVLGEIYESNERPLGESPL